MSRVKIAKRVGAGVAFLVGLVAFFEVTVPSVAASLWRVYARVVLVELFGREIVLVAVALISARWLGITVGRVRAELREKIPPVAGRLLSVRTMLVILAASLAIGVVCWEGKWLVVGKHLQMQLHPRVMRNRAFALFNRGQSAKAVAYLEVCEKLFNSRVCGRAKHELTVRLEEATVLRNLLERVPKYSSERVRLISDVFRLDRDHEGCAAAARERRAFLGELARQYRKTAKEIEEGHCDNVSAALQSMEKAYPGFGDVDVLSKELVRYPCGTQLPPKPDEAPYLAALRLRGADVYAASTLEPFLDVNLKNPEALCVAEASFGPSLAGQSGGEPGDGTPPSAFDPDLAGQSGRERGTGFPTPASGTGVAAAEMGHEFLPSTLKYFQRNLGAEEVAGPGENSFVMDARTPGLSVVARFTGRVREIGARKLEVLRAAMTGLGRKPFSELYKREIEVDEQGRKRWIPVQDKLCDELIRDVRTGGLVGMDIRYLGSYSPGVPENNSAEVSPEFVFVMINFRDDAMAQIQKSTCFADHLLGVSPGNLFDAAAGRLRKSYGDPIFAAKRDDERRYEAYVVDGERHTVMTIADGGPQYPGRVHTVQLSGDKNPQIELANGLHLGDNLSKVETQLGKPKRTFAAGDGYMQWDFENSPCSIEIKDDVLASVLLAVDPYYFQE